MHMNIADLSRFLLDSNMAGFAGGEPKKWIKEKDSSTTIPYTKGEWSSHDNFFGGEPYGGRVVVSYNNQPVWIMVYYGWVQKGLAPDPVYATLKEALKNMPNNAPLRGPKELKVGEYFYSNSWKGTVASYSGTEQITHLGKLIYEASYMGGLVDEK
jgi:hypothetical protein